jgi:hypothetical protein
MHCQMVADPGLTVLSLFGGRKARRWWLMPFSSFHTCQ